MSQHDMNITNADGATFRADLNTALQAIAENNSGATTPSTTFSYQLWADTANDLMKIRNAANSAWIVLFKLSTAGFEQGADIISASALPVLADGEFNDVTGATGITSINALGIGTIKWLQFDGIVTITHHSTNLILPDGRDITTVAGDILCFYEYATGDWRLISNTGNSTPFRKGTDIATNSAGNLTPTSNHNAFDVTGTDAVTSIDAVAVGTLIILRFDGVVTLTHHATNLDLGGSNITTVAGQILTFHEYATGDWRMISNSASATSGASYVRLHDSKATTTDGGTFTSGAWQKRTVTEDIDVDAIVAVSSSVIVLDAGTYDCLITCPAYTVQMNQARLYNTSDSVIEVLGTTTYADTTDANGCVAIVQGRFTVGASKNLEIQHRCASTRADNGFGLANDFGGDEIYTVAEFRKVS